MWKAFEIRRHSSGWIETYLGASPEDVGLTQSRGVVWKDHRGNTCDLWERPIDLKYDWQPLVNAYTDDWIENLDHFRDWLTTEVGLLPEQVEIAVSLAKRRGKQRAEV